MADRAALLKRLYDSRAARGVCVRCETPSAPFVHCVECRSDAASLMRQRRYLTRLRVTVIEAHHST